MNSKDLNSMSAERRTKGILPALPGIGLVAVLLAFALWAEPALADKVYKWKDRSGQTHITSHYPSKSLIKKGTRVEVLDSGSGPSNVVIQTETMSDEQRREIANRKSKAVELSRERDQLEEEKSYLELRVRKQKIDLRRLEKKLEYSESADDISGDGVSHQERMDKTKTSLTENTSRLRVIELRLLRLKQEIENLK